VRRLSASSLKTYLRCPQKWKLKYVDGHEQEDRPFFNLGRAVHAALEAFYDGRVSGPPPLEEVLEAFREEFDPGAYPDEEERERRRADGLRMVREFHEKHAEDFRPALAVEKRLQFEVEGVPFLGYVDRIDRTDDDRLRIVDYKTGGDLDLDRVRGSTQLTLYQLGAEEKFGREVDTLVLYHVPTQTPFEAERHDDEQVDRVKGKVRTVARGIEEEAFEPSPGGHCDWCDFQPFCPAFADRYPENWQEDGEAVPGAPSSDEAAELADRYGRLKQRRSELSSELGEIEDRLETYFEATDRRAVAGDEFRVKASRREEWRIDDDETLRRILEPAGLWDRVLRPAWHEKKKLPEDEDLPEAVREQVRDIGYRKVLWTLTPSERDGTHEEGEEE